MDLSPTRRQRGVEATGTTVLFKDGGRVRDDVFVYIVGSTNRRTRRNRGVRGYRSSVENRGGGLGSCSGVCRRLFLSFLLSFCLPPSCKFFWTNIAIEGLYILVSCNELVFDELRSTLEIPVGRRHVRSCVGDSGGRTSRRHTPDLNDHSGTSVRRCICVNS